MNFPDIEDTHSMASWRVGEAALDHRICSETDSTIVYMNRAGVWDSTPLFVVSKEAVIGFNTEFSSDSSKFQLTNEGWTLATAFQFSGYTISPKDLSLGRSDSYGLLKAERQLATMLVKLLLGHET